MPQHHPSLSVLLQYSAGNLNPALALCVSTHLHHCKACQKAVQLLDCYGGELIEQAKPAKVSSNSFDRVMKAINEAEAAKALEETLPLEESALSANGRKRVVPSALSAYASHLPAPLQPTLQANAKSEWTKLSSCLDAMHIKVGQDQYEANFHRIARGGKVLEHDHKGHEVTVVLYGSFSDENGSYQVGDYVERMSGERHTPTATQDSECLCLSVVDAPVKLTGVLNRIINPFIPHRPA